MSKLSQHQSNYQLLKKSKRGILNFRWMLKSPRNVRTTQIEKKSWLTISNFKILGKYAMIKSILYKQKIIKHKLIELIKSIKWEKRLQDNSMKESLTNCAVLNELANRKNLNPTEFFSFTLYEKKKANHKTKQKSSGSQNF